jgi:hypothetical protein
MEPCSQTASLRRVLFEPVNLVAVGPLAFMPWTFAHPAAVLPLRRFCPLRLRFAALMVVLRSSVMWHKNAPPNQRCTEPECLDLGDQHER